MADASSVTTSLVVFLLILVGPIIGIWTSRRHSRTQGHSESDLRFGTYVTGLSASASANSGSVLIGAAGLGFVMGVSALWLALGFWIGDIIFWYLFADKLVRRVQETGVDTISELIAQQSHSRPLIPLRVGALVAIIAVGLYCIAQFLAVGKIAMEFFNIEVTHAVALVLFVGVISILLGGLGSSMMVNVYQAFLMICSAAIICAFVGFAVVADFSTLSNAEGAERLLDPFYGYSGMNLVLFVTTFIFQGLLFAMCNPHILTRITKGNVDQIPRIRWVYMGFMQTLWWIMTAVGVSLALLAVTASDPDSASIAFAEGVMPPIVLGVFIAGIAAAALSTGEAQLLVIANALVMDLVPNSFQKLSDSAKRKAMIAGRIVVAIGAFTALLFLKLDLVAQLVIQAASILLSAFAIPALMFIFRISVDGRVMGLVILCGGGGALIARIFNPSLPLGYEIYSGLSAALVIACTGLAFSRSPEKSK